MASTPEAGGPVQSIAVDGFWKRQYALNVTRPQIVFDAFFGAVLPVVCLFMDPGIFRSGGLPGTSLLTHFGLFAYLEIALCIAALIFYLVTRRSSLFLAGMLYAGMLFSLAVGIMILPLTIVGVFVLIGVLGLTPFLTAFVFLRNARRCWNRSSRKAVPTAILASAATVAMTVIVPLAIQFETVRITNHAMETLRTGTEEEASRAIHTLKLARIVIDTDRLAIAYGNTGDEKVRERLARAYHELTGEKVEDRLAELND